LLPEKYIKLSFIRKYGNMAPEWTENKGKGKEKLSGKIYSSRGVVKVAPDTVQVDMMVYERMDISLNLPWMRNYIGTLLHEIGHALFGLWACNCDKCEVDDLATKGHPTSGHGPAWMRISLKLERMMRRVFGYECWLDEVLRWLLRAKQSAATTVGKISPLSKSTDEYTASTVSLVRQYGFC